MTQVVVVEFDATLRGTLHDNLTAAGPYDVTEVAVHTVALAHLASVPEGTVTVVSNRDADHHHSAAFFATVVADECLATRHCYIMLSTNPIQSPDGMRAHLAHMHVPILANPFDRIGL
jgi:hypothetical protein